MSDIFDIAVVLYDEKTNRFYELELDDYSLEQPSDFPVRAFLKKGKVIPREELDDYYG